MYVCMLGYQRVLKRIMYELIAITSRRSALRMTVVLRLKDKFSLVKGNRSNVFLRSRITNVSPNHVQRVKKQNCLLLLCTVNI